MAHNFLGLNRKHENFRKGVFMDAYDEPTYLTFALDFRFENVPVTNPTAESGLYNSPLFDKTSNNGAIGFLTNRGYDAQANGISTFTEILKHLTHNAPWYFQSLEGLSTLYGMATDQSKGWKTGGESLVIETLEAIDLRIFELAGLYRNAIFDTKYRRERVPDNLRWFTMDVYVAEFRNLRYALPGVAQQGAQVLGIDTGAIGSIVGGGNAFSNVIDQFGYIKFTCRQCEFDFSKTFPTKSSISIGSDNRSAETNEFSIKVGWVDEEVKFGDGTKIYDDNIKTEIKNPWGARNVGTQVQNAGSFLSGLPIIGEPIQQAGQKAADALGKVGGLINPALGAASRFINPPVSSLGDAHNIGYSTNGDTPPKYNQAPSGDAYDIGYTSNGDTPPNYRTPSNENVYPNKSTGSNGPSGGQIG